MDLAVQRSPRFSIEELLENNQDTHAEGIPNQYVVTQRPGHPARFDLNLTSITPAILGKIFELIAAGTDTPPVSDNNPWQ